ncbi:hypothetical protein WJX74_004722 [Apatococcus lobatus]|uniref:Core domain-containing protein n=1 Tax=Apatococcus lobatus TaxID=904363 RepID=A0AAW1Q273_9CHLO
MRGVLSHVCKALRQQAQAALPCSQHLTVSTQLQDTVRALCLVNQRVEVLVPGRTRFDWTAPFQTSTRRSALSLAAAQAQPEPQASFGDLVITDSAVERLQQLAGRSDATEAALRISVDSGGCSGFQYKFELDDQLRPNDRIFEQAGVRVVADTVSMEFLRGAVIDFTTDLIRSGFEVAENPNSKGGCGCGASFEPR